MSSTTIQEEIISINLKINILKKLFSNHERMEGSAYR
jgi:hypothetical protein